MNAAQFLNDIPTDTARAAYAGMSFTPERRAEQVRDGYAELMAADYAALASLIEDKPEMQPVLEAEFARYREGYRARYLKKLHSDSRCVSWMIAGPSNFPVRRMEKRNAAAQKRSEETMEFRKRALDTIRKTLCPELRPIMSGDSDAAQRLAEKIAEAEKLQERMKGVNAILRKHLGKDVEAGKLALVEIGCTAPEAERIFTTKDCFGGYGYASFELTNNGANIRRMKERYAVIARNQSKPASQVEGTNARIEDSPAENRVRLFFPGKPAEDVRSRLKSSGFRWSPNLGCWQAYRNHNAMEAAKREAGWRQPVTA